MPKKEIPKWIKELSREELEKQYFDALTCRVPWVQSMAAEAIASQKLLLKCRDKICDLFDNGEDHTPSGYLRDYLDKWGNKEIEELYNAAMEKLKKEAEE